MILNGIFNSQRKPLGTIEEKEEKEGKGVGGE